MFHIVTYSILKFVMIKDMHSLFHVLNSENKEKEHREELRNRKIAVKTGQTYKVVQRIKKIS